MSLLAATNPQKKKTEMSTGNAALDREVLVGMVRVGEMKVIKI